jgi:hypothetical protein
MSPTQPLTTEECEVLGALVDPGARIPDRSVGMLARRLDMAPKQVATRLEGLRARSPALVVLVPDEEWAVQAWFPTDEGRKTYEERCA